MTKKLVCFGDSFADGKNEGTWISQLAIQNNWNRESFGLGGSGPIYAIEKFFEYIQSGQDFDIAIFCWSEPSRLYNTKVRDVNSYTSQYIPKNKTKDEIAVYKASAQYLQYFYRSDIGQLQLSGVLRWFDSYLKENFSDKLFFHFQCFNASLKWMPGDKENFSPKDIENWFLLHLFESGVTAYPPLLYLSINDPDFVEFGDEYDRHRHGHLAKDQHIALSKLLTHYITDVSRSPNCKTVLISDHVKRIKHLYESFPGEWHPYFDPVFNEMQKK
jgi:hypothetical protein